MFRPMPLIHQRGSKYVVRRGVPERLRPIIGKREIVSSLDERDPAEAKRRGFAVMAEIQRLFAEAEAELKNPSVRVYKTLHEDAEASPVASPWTQGGASRARRHHGSSRQVAARART